MTCHCVYEHGKAICFEPHKSGDRPSASDHITAGNLQDNYVNTYRVTPQYGHF